MKQFSIFVLLIFYLISFTWKNIGKENSKPSSNMPKREFMLGEIDRTAIARVHVEGFDELPVKEKIFAYYLYKAAIAGDRILYDQNHKHGVEVKTILEEVLTHSDRIDKSLLKKLGDYTQLYWIHHGNRDHQTSLKFTPTFTYDELVQMAVTALKNGAQFAYKNESALRTRLGELRRTIFDRSFESMLTSKSPAPGQDIITASVNNLYDGVTAKDLTKLNEKYPLNSKLVKQDGRIVELVYRVGGDGTVPGLYAQELGRINEYLNKALEYAEPPQEETLKHLIKYFMRGEAEDFRHYNIAWVKDNPAVDTINGFIEVYKDARAAKGAYEGLVYFIDKKTTKMMRDLADNAQYFEGRMPWLDQYKKKQIKPPVANTVTVLIETGDSGPISPVGINLPNEQAIRQQYGSKNIMLTNINQTAEQINSVRISRVFSYSEEEKKLANEYGATAAMIHIGLHEVVGHGSGKVSDRLKEDPRTYLKEFYSTLEEARADLVGLWHLYDPKLIELAILPNEQAAQAGYQRYVRGVLAQLRTVPTAGKLEEDHMKGRQMIVNYLKDVSHAVEVKVKNGDTYLVVNDFRKMRQGVGRLLAEIMRIKAEGDYPAIKKLVDTYGTNINREWRDNVVARAKAAKIPSVIAYVYPKLELVKDARGRITDVKLSYYKTLMQEQLDFRDEYKRVE